MLAGDRLHDVALNVPNLGDDAAYAIHGVDGVGRITADGCSDAVDLCGCLFGFLGQVFDFTGDYGEALSGLANPGGFDAGIEGQQVCLPGDSRDVVEHRGNVATANAEAVNGSGGLVCGRRSGGGNAGCLAGLVGDVSDTGAYRLRTLGHRARVASHAVRLVEYVVDPGFRRLRTGRHITADLPKLRGVPGQLVSAGGHLAHGVVESDDGLIECRRQPSDLIVAVQVDALG